MKIIIRNGLVAHSSCSFFSETDILLCNGLIEKLIPRGTPVRGEARVVDAAGKYILPGLIDIHNHGGMGVYYANADDFSVALNYHARNGVTTVLPTISCRPMEDILSAIGRVLAQQEKNTGARIGGLHLEGPFLSPKKKGAMLAPDIPCSVENFDKIYEAARGQLRVMTIAPERENALEVIRRGAQRGVRMSVGHTDADYAQALAAIRAGALGATHTFNAMRGLNHRDPGVLGAVLTEPDVVCEAICDMVHLAPATVKLILATKGTERTILISDSVIATGYPDGEYVYDGKPRIVKNGVSMLPDGTISGSCFCMADGAGKLVELGCTLLDIAKMGARNPAEAVGLRDRGRIGEGLLADLILCDEKMRVSTVFLRGQPITQEV